jgi:hypothetical protein
MSDNILTHFEQIKAQGLSIDITRGKPDKYQLDLANDLLSMSVEPFDGNVDLRNYGEPYGIQDARFLGSDLLSAPIDNVITGEQSSLMLTYQLILSKYLFAKPVSWRDIEAPKFICPVPGFDRHFRMLEDFGIEMITVPLVEMVLILMRSQMLLQSNSNVLGIICVPRHSNPSGEVYSDENINELFKIGKQYSEDFLFLFDHAYLVHDFLPTKNQTAVWKLAEQNRQPIKQ